MGKQKYRTRKVSIEFLLATEDNDEQEKDCFNDLLAKSGTNEAKEAAVAFVAKLTGLEVIPCDTDKVVIKIKGWPQSKKPEGGT
jgi:hypothetical protein